MSIEKELQQNSPFDSIEQKTMVNLFFTHGWLMYEMKKLLKNYDITLQQYNILRILKGAKKPLSTSMIRERMIDRMSDTTRLINRMILKSFVTKIVSTTDKRLVDIKITEIGLTKLEEVSKEIKQMDVHLKNLSSAQHNELNSLLDTLRG